MSALTALADVSLMTAEDVKRVELLIVWARPMTRIIIRENENVKK